MKTCTRCDGPLSDEGICPTCPPEHRAGAPSSPKRNRKRWIAVIVIIIVLIAAAGAYWLYQNSPKSSSNARTVTDLLVTAGDLGIGWSEQYLPDTDSTDQYASAEIWFSEEGDDLTSTVIIMLMRENGTDDAAMRFNALVQGQAELYPGSSYVIGDQGYFGVMDNTTIVLVHQREYVFMVLGYEVYEAIVQDIALKQLAKIA